MLGTPPYWKPSKIFLWSSDAFFRFCLISKKSGLKLLITQMLRWFIFVIIVFHLEGLRPFLSSVMVTMTPSLEQAVTLSSLNSACSTRRSTSHTFWPRKWELLTNIIGGKDFSFSAWNVPPLHNLISSERKEKSFQYIQFAPEVCYITSPPHYQQWRGV